MRRGRRHVRVPPDLTSLFDVLFIVIFVALIRAAAAQQAADAATKPAPPPPPPPVKPEPVSASELRTRALAQLTAQLESRPTVIARIAQAGKLIALESGDKHVTLDVPLLEHSPDPDIAMAYLGDRSAELRVCRLVALHLGVPDLAQYLVIITPDARGADLPHALYTGLRRDLDRCLAEQRGLAVVVEPGAAP
jgi:hypothetical protein